MRRKLLVIFGVMAALSFTGIPAALAVFLWTVAIPFMQHLQ